MDIPYGFDCYTFSKNEVKLFERDVIKIKHSFIGPPRKLKNRLPPGVSSPNGQSDLDYVMFTRKNEDYSPEQLRALAEAGRLNVTENYLNKKVFCGIKIQIGISVVANFLQTGLQYRPPIRGKSELVNGSWTGIVGGLTIDHENHNSYEIAFGNFLAYDEEYPYIKFGPFFAIESKLLMLTGSSRAIEASAFGTNMSKEVYLTVALLIIILSVLAAFRVHWQHTKSRAMEEFLNNLIEKTGTGGTQSEQVIDVVTSGGDPASVLSNKQKQKTEVMGPKREEISILHLVLNFLFIYITMLLNKPSVEFDDLIWPKPAGHSQKAQAHWQQYKLQHHNKNYNHERATINRLPKEVWDELPEKYREMIERRRRKKRHLPSTTRVLSYIWSAACLVMASIYSGEMLAVILLHADQNIDTVHQLINSKPPIEPVIRQDDFTYNLMLKSLDENLLRLHKMTKIIPRTEVYTRRFIENVSNRKQALLGDDELIETIYDIYHKYYPLYKSKVTYLQFPISIMYRKDFNSTKESQLRRGIVQIFEMGLIQRWYQAQKDTYIQWYDTYEKKDADKKDSQVRQAIAAADPKYKPLSVRQFESFFRFMIMCKLFAFFVLIMEMIHYKLTHSLEASNEVHYRE